MQLDCQERNLNDSRRIKHMIRTSTPALVSALFASTLIILPCPSFAVTLEWARQFGTSSGDYAYGVSADGLGNVYVSGYSEVSIGGNYDAFLSKYNSTGTRAWTRQLGTNSDDVSWGVSADGLGNVYISGYTYGSLAAANSGIRDAFLSKYDATGMLAWTRQLGTFDYEESSSVSADGLGNVYISGSTYSNLGGPNAGFDDAFVSKYDAAGTLVWTRQLGTSSGENSNSVSADGLGSVYISGRTYGSLSGANSGGPDAFISKYDASGTLIWTRQLGTSDYDTSNGVSADRLGNVYISGFTRGSLEGANAGGYDAFITKYDAAGTLAWTRQLGTSSEDVSNSVSADGLGNVYISGYTRGSLGGANAGDYDAFVSKYDATGTQVWTHQLGTNTADLGFGVSADGLGNVYIGGYTPGIFSEPRLGHEDAFVAKFSDVIVPEPNAIILAIATLLGPSCARLHRRKNHHLTSRMIRGQFKRQQPVRSKLTTYSPTYSTRQIVPAASSVTTSAPVLVTATPTGRPHTLPSGVTKPVKKSSYSPVATPRSSGMRMTL